MRYLKVKIFVTSVLILILGLVLISSPRVSAQKERGPSVSEQKLLGVVANRESLDVNQLQVLKSTTVELPLTGRKVQVAKIINPNDGRTFGAATDEQGREIDFDTLEAAERGAYRARYDKLDPKLHKKVETTDNSQNIRVAFWLKPAEDLDANDPRDGRTDMSAAEVDQLLAERSEQVKAANSRASLGLTRALERAGHMVEQRGEGAPVVFATLPAGLVKQFSQRADVQTAYLAQDEQYSDQMNVAGPSIKADALWSLGITGVGARIAIVEDSRVDFGNSCLAANNLGTRVPNDPNVDDHATACAGIAASTNPEFSGIAPGAGIYSSNIVYYGDANKIAAAMDAASQNADVSNYSWGLDGCGAADGSINNWGRHADYIVRYIWDTVTASAGNSGLCISRGYVNSVAAGFNTIAVGNYDDAGTITSADNVMSPTSSWEDPLSTHGDREKPEVAAPGVAITSTVMSPTLSCDLAEIGSGTSFSAPAVAGLAAALMQAQPTLKAYPESVKALIMAGATDNVEGFARLSERDGAGGVNALTSYTSAINNRYLWRYVAPSSFDSNRFITYSMGWVSAGQRVKVALVWDSSPSGDYETDPLKADLDLFVTGPNNQSLISASWDNSYEVVDFIATTTGFYQIKVRNYRFDSVSEYMAVAWSLS